MEFINELDREITLSEIEKVIISTCMNISKSCDVDNNVADFFIKYKDFISPYLCCIFNTIYL